MASESSHSDKSVSQGAAVHGGAIERHMSAAPEFADKTREQVGTPSEFRRRPFYPTFGNEFLDSQGAIESNARTYPRRLPLALKSGRGIRVRDVEGREYIDCLAGAGALALGHNHPVVVQAIQSALSEDAPLQTLDLPTPLEDRFVNELFDSLPAQFRDQFKIQFCGPSGADAIEAALKLVKTATGRRGLLAFHGADHGMTHGALSVSEERVPKSAISGLSAKVQFLRFPSDHHCPTKQRRGSNAAAAHTKSERCRNDCRSLWGGREGWRARRATSLTRSRHAKGVAHVPHRAVISLWLRRSVSWLGKKTKT